MNVRYWGDNGYFSVVKRDIGCLLLMRFVLFQLLITKKKEVKKVEVLDLSPGSECIVVVLLFSGNFSTKCSFQRILYADIR